MASVVNELRGLALAPFEIQRLTGWSDPMVEEFSSFIENLVTISQAIDNTNQVVDDNDNQTIDHLVPDIREFDSFAVSTDFETTGNQKIACTNTAPITVTFNPTPNDMEELTIIRTDATVTADGNGKMINGQPTVTLARQYVALELTYVLDVDAWFIT